MLRIGDDGIDISWMRTALSVYRSVFTFFFSFFFYVLKNFRPKLSCLFVFFFFFLLSFFLVWNISTRELPGKVFFRRFSRQRTGQVSE